MSSEAVPQGAGKWWGRVLVKNTGEKKDTHPNRCALGCGMLWTASGCNALQGRPRSAHGGSKSAWCPSRAGEAPGAWERRERLMGVGTHVR